MSILKTIAFALTGLASATVVAAGSGGVERNAQAFLDAVNNGGGQPIESLAVGDARKVLVDAQAGAVLAPADVSKKSISVDGQNVKLDIVRPSGVKGVLPAFIFIHGGGWVLGDFPSHERLVRDLVADSGITAVFVNYSRSPEAKYPVAINEIYGTLKWVAEHGAEINVDGKRLAVVGNSVGGNMAAVTALMAKKKGGPLIKSQILLWPVTNADFETESYHRFENGYFLTRSMMKWFWDAYAIDSSTRSQIYASPLLATKDDLEGLPPALLVTAENDVLRDEGEAYGRNLDAAGVPTVMTRYNGMIHDFGLLNFMSNTPSARALVHQVSEELRMRLR